MIVTEVMSHTGGSPETESDSRSARKTRSIEADSAAGTPSAGSGLEGITTTRKAFPVEGELAVDHDAEEVEFGPELKALLDELANSDNASRLQAKPRIRPAVHAPPRSSKPASSASVPLAGVDVRVLTPPKLVGVPTPTPGSSATPPSTAARQTLCFPVVDVTSIEAVADPRRAMNALCRELAVHQDYERIRDEYCRLAIQMNGAKALAPAFRPQVVTSARRGDPVYMLIHRDRVVIDYHWCHATAMEMHPLEPRHAALLDLNHEFNFLQAWDLACCRTRSKYRGAEALALTTVQQCQTLTLRGPELAERAKRLVSDYRESNGKFSSRRAVAMRLIREWTCRTAVLKAQTRVYECLWQARELLGPDNISQLPALVALMTGEPPKDRKTIKDKLVSLDKHVRVP